MTAVTGTAICPFCVSAPGIGVAKATISGTIVTPSGTATVDFEDETSFENAFELVRLHRNFGGRPAIEHLCPVAGHQVYLYTDTAGGSQEVGA
jgi:hypothetical protein